MYNKVQSICKYAYTEIKNRTLQRAAPLGVASEQHCHTSALG